MKILVACEHSGLVRDAFIRMRNNAFSCDLLPTEGVYKESHYQCDIKEILNREWDMMIAFPPCTHLAVSGARWFKQKKKEQKEATKRSN